MDHKIEEMISEQQIAERIHALATEINQYYDASNELVVIGLLRGSFVFMADLCREIEHPHRIDFMTASSYGNNTTSSRHVKILKDLEEDIQGKDVLIVEDIIDTGNTLSEICNILTLRHPNSLNICTLLDKPCRREVEVDVKWIGFQIPDEFVVGFGIDYAQSYRNLRFIGKVLC